MFFKQINKASSSSIIQNNLMKFRHANFRPFSTSSTPQDDQSKVVYKNHSDSVFEFKLNAPKVLNSIDVEMVDLMLTKVEHWHHKPNEAPRVCMISGTGGKAFCAGGDIKCVYDAHVGKQPANVKQDFFGREYLLDY